VVGVITNWFKGLSRAVQKCSVATLKLIFRYMKEVVLLPLVVKVAMWHSLNLLKVLPLLTGMTKHQLQL
jgi:hypothetical protein